MEGGSSISEVPDVVVGKMLKDKKVNDICSLWIFEGCIPGHFSLTRRASNYQYHVHM